MTPATPRASAQQLAREQAVDALCGASMRALCGDAAATLRARRLWRGGRPVRIAAPHVAPFDEEGDAIAFRGAADGMAMRMLHCDAALHARHAPQEPMARALFEVLEQLRCESLAPARLAGVRRNLAQRHAQWAEAFAHSGLAETERGLLLLTVALVCRARIHGEPVHGPAEELIEATRMAIAPLLGRHLAGLRRARTDQATYARHARAIAEWVSARLGEGAQAGRRRAVHEREDARSDRLLRIALDFASDGVETADGAGTVATNASDHHAGAYRIFTTAYDEERHATTLVREAVRRTCREQLERRIALECAPLQRLARALQAALACPLHDGWDAAQEEGRLDGRALAQLVASPTERRLFRSERHAPHAEAVVTFLVDCSGSMKAHAEFVAMWIDVHARALEQAGAACEVLGFTTGAWNGGRARRDWQRAGRPTAPGRLNEVCHLVFKDADTPWRRARRDIAALLKPDLFREGIDGEAVEWACRRLAARAERRRILVVMSDGCPMDRATELANDGDCLERHLREVVSRWERSRAVEIVGIGLGLDLAAIYPFSLSIDPSQPGSRGRWHDLVQALAPRRAVRGR